MQYLFSYFWFREFCDENNFRFCDIHSLRHFYASALINEGVDAAAVSGALGHSVISTTLNLYSHMFRENQIKACDAVANALSFTTKDSAETENPHHANDTENDKKIE